MKKLFAIIVVLIFAMAAWHYRFGLQKFFQKLPELSKVPAVSEVVQQILAPPPLVGQSDNSNSYLTREGVISWTNTNRQAKWQFAGFKRKPVFR